MRTSTTSGTDLFGVEWGGVRGVYGVGAQIGVGTFCVIFALMYVSPLPVLFF